MESDDETIVPTEEDRRIGDAYLRGDIDDLDEDINKVNINNEAAFINDQSSGPSDMLTSSEVTCFFRVIRSFDIKYLIFPLNLCLRREYLV